MKKNIYRTKNSLNDTLDWYWIHGLHDAKIEQANQLQFNYDYKLRNPRRNCFEIILDASGALYDIKVKALRFYNYKIIKGSVEVAAQWWMCDSLSHEDGKYVLKITTTDCKDDYELTFKFEDAEIERCT